MSISLDQVRAAMPQQGCYGTQWGIAHSQPGSKAMSQVMPPTPGNLSPLDGSPKPSLQVGNIGMSGRVATGEHPFRPLPGIQIPQDFLGFFIQGGILHPTGFRLWQGDQGS